MMPEMVNAKKNAPKKGAKPEVKGALNAASKALPQAQEFKGFQDFRDPDHTLYLIDVSSFIFRAFYAIRVLHNQKGEPTNAVYGVASMLNRLVEQAQPRYVAVAYDSKEPSFRKEMYASYKANRTAPPDDLIPQFEKIETLIRLFGLSSFRQAGVEADDLIASLTVRWLKKSPQNRVVILTGDKDLMQLVDDRVVVWDTMKEKIFHFPEVEEKFGIKPSQMRDYLALVGDSSDNIPGVPSIGPKTAVDLLKEHGSLQGVLEAAKEGKIAGKKGQVIQAHEKDALISAELATLKSDIPLQWEPSSLRFQFECTPSFVEFLREMNFKTLIARWTQKKLLVETPPTEQLSLGPSSPVVKSNARVDVSSVTEEDLRTFRLVTTEKEFLEVLRELEKAKEFGVDLETTSLNPRHAEIVGISLCYDPEFGIYLPVGHEVPPSQQLSKARVLEKLKPFLVDSRYKKVGQNLKYDWSVLFEHGIEMDGIGCDTMVASYVLDPSGRHNLETLCLRYLNYQPLNYEDVCGKGKDQIPFSQVPLKLAARYSAEDAWCAMRLWKVLGEKLEQSGSLPVFAQVDMPLVPVLARIERTGVSIDRPWLESLSLDFEKEIQVIEKKIFQSAKKPFNLNSPKQLSQFLFEELKLPVQGRTKTGLSTDAFVLEKLASFHEVPRLLIEYREISKLRSTYVDPLPTMVDSKTGRIHASFHQTVAATGRLSSSDPNLQNIPIRSDRGKKIRQAFIPSSGGVLLSADYSQIELRILAHMSGDPDLVESFKRGEDIHRRTASELFSTSVEGVTSEQRGIAKAINFGLMYGKTAFGLSQELGISRQQAKDIIDRYFQRYAAVKRYLDGLIQTARDKGYAMTELGRKRILPEIHSKNAAVRAFGERMAMNTPMQGTAADLMKLAMIELDSELRKKGYQSKIIIQVHDELVLDCPKKEIPEVQPLVERTMETAVKLKVPLVVESSYGPNWNQMDS